MVDNIYNEMKSLMQKTITHYQSELSKISIALQNFFETLKAVKKHGKFYLKNANNKVGDIKRLVKNTSKIIGSVLKSLIQRSRDFLLDKIRTAISRLIDILFPTTAKVWKNTIIGQIVNTVLCKFKDIIAGLANLGQDSAFLLDYPPELMMEFDKFYLPLLNYE